MTHKGVVAAGHEETVHAAAVILEEGGNAFDAALAGMLAACVAEPVLCSLGGGGFMLAHAAGRSPVVYDFFVQTPKERPNPGALDFFPIMADFGAAQQEFHIGRGSIATPGMVKGLFKVHEELGWMPMKRLIEPAAALARNGVRMNRLQAYIFTVVEPIYTAKEESRRHFGSRENPGRLLAEGETLKAPDFADALEALAREGDDLFYQGDMARRMVADCRAGGVLTRSDLEEYRVVRRAPLKISLAGTRLFTNPPPSTGGILIAFAVALLRGAGLGDAGFGSVRHLGTLAEAMRQTNKARIDGAFHGGDEAALGLLDPGFVETYRKKVLGAPPALRGTTHISIIDRDGNAAGISMSNGEGSGYMIPGTAIMLNNMLGEEDINPAGFHQWAPDRRMCSMMAPSLLASSQAGSGGDLVMLGSGGSNRIRTAILQVILNLLEFGQPIAEAVAGPRIHYENGRLSIEPGFDAVRPADFGEDFEEIKLWDEKNLFFGGVHAAARTGENLFEGAGDPRRGGVVMVV
jgi:gamma-glutamyltranspeptidase/glutathione hydrolase